MIYNKKHKKKPFIIHAPGNKLNLDRYNEINKIWSRFKLLRNNIDTISLDIEILTCNSTSEKGSFEKSMDSMGYSYKVMKDCLPWKNINKIDLFYRAIKNSKKKHILGCDSFDAICIKEIPKIDIDELKGMMISSESIFFPDHPYLDDEKKFESKNCFLNSGCWVGDRETCLEFFEVCIEEKNKKPQLKNEVFDNSDQLVFHKAYRRMKECVKIDCTCSFFQTVTFCGLETLFPVKSIL